MMSSMPSLRGHDVTGSTSRGVPVTPRGQPLGRGRSAPPSPLSLRPVESFGWTLWGGFCCQPAPLVVWSQMGPTVRAPGGGNGNHFSILVWRVPWTEDLKGYSPRGCKESDMTAAECTHSAHSTGRAFLHPAYLWGSPQVASGQTLPQVWVSPVRGQQGPAQGPTACCPLTPWQGGCQGPWRLHWQSRRQQRGGDC